MQNFGGPPQGGMYGGSGGPGMNQFPQPTGFSTQHHAQHKIQLQQYQTVRSQQLHNMLQAGQISTAQFQNEIHLLNEKIQSSYNKYNQQCVQQQQRMQQQQQGGGGGGGGGVGPPQQPSQQQMGGVSGNPSEIQMSSSSSSNRMPPPQLPPPGAGMSVAEKKKMMEIQKQRALMAQQQQQQQQHQQQGGGAGMRFPPGTTLQQQQQMRMQQQYQQQQQQQNSGGYRGMSGPGYPGMGGGMQGGMPQHLQQQHMQPPQTPQSHGPASVSNPPSVQQQQQFQQQQQYYQQQQQNQQMHLQQQQQQQLQQQQQQQLQHQQQLHHQQQQQQQQMQQQQQQHPQQQDGPFLHPQAVVAAAAPPPPQPVEKPEDIKYKEMIKELRAQYYEFIQAMVRRQTQQRGLVPMLQILDGERTVPYANLINLKASLHRLTVRDCPTFHLMEEIRKNLFKKKEEREKAAEMSFSEKDTNLSAVCEKADKRLISRSKDDPFEVKPWASLKHLMIQVPDHVRELIKGPHHDSSPLKEIKEELEAEIKEEAESKSSLKRKIEDDEDGYEAMVQEAKKPKEDSGEHDEQRPDEDPAMINPIFVIKTVFEQRKPWIIPPKARDELIELSNWNVDDHCLPSCSTSPFIIISVKSSQLLINPLRISLPNNYPASPATVQFDLTFPEHSEYGPTLQKLFEKHLATKSAVRSLIDFVEAYNAACDEYQTYISKYTCDDSSPSSSKISPIVSRPPEKKYKHPRKQHPRHASVLKAKGIVI